MKLGKWLLGGGVLGGILLAASDAFAAPPQRLLTRSMRAAKAPAKRAPTKPHAAKPAKPTDAKPRGKRQA